jgi:hypothetical protein
MSKQWHAGMLAAVAIIALSGACSRPQEAAPGAGNGSAAEGAGSGPPPHAARDAEPPAVGGSAGESVNTAPDPVTDCPDSDTRPTVIIRGCDTGVANVAVGPCTLADQIHPCEAGSAADFPRCIAKVTERLIDTGVIHGKDKGALQICAADDREEE